jgi:uncharacterized protein YaaQ
MKLAIVVIESNKNHQYLSDILLKADFRLTKLPTTSGLWKKVTTTFFIGVDEDKIDELIHIIKNYRMENILVSESKVKSNKNDNQE